MIKQDREFVNERAKLKEADSALEEAELLVVALENKIEKTNSELLDIQQDLKYLENRLTNAEKNLEKKRNSYIKISTIYWGNYYDTKN